jgi:pyruvate carboxylase
MRRGGVPTSFIDERPHLLTSRHSSDRGTKLLSWMADVTVNRPHGEAKVMLSPEAKLPAADLSAPAPAGWRQRLLDLGPEGFAAARRARPAVAITDTTFRDAHQSLLATRVRTRDLIAAGRQRRGHRSPAGGCRPWPGSSWVGDWPSRVG